MYFLLKNKLLPNFIILLVFSNHMKYDIKKACFLQSGLSIRGDEKQGVLHLLWANGKAHSRRAEKGGT